MRRDLNVRALRSRMFVVDPSLYIINPTIAGWVTGHRYFLDDANPLGDPEWKPIRQVNVYANEQAAINNGKGAVTATWAQLATISPLLTLIQPDGRYIIRNIPVLAFAAQRGVASNGTGNGKIWWWQKFFAKGTIPDPRQSYVTVTETAASTQTLAIEFVYATT